MGSLADDRPLLGRTSDRMTVGALDLGDSVRAERLLAQHLDGAQANLVGSGDRGV
ncbi:hypothetical protein OG897_14465 [Streptomyces sp. NBC_00237]|uniref:hypothetical protein n=1 Tax=Streptomyces sp. NBC_00237 TaxID=2975687 RepID=UPI0022519704|nr:hypothetical protein [Streptomyces sp. NBC_00237]MCX5202649.1 hypothetical protein [Streptomyces sp. NBC_00237]